MSASALPLISLRDLGERRMLRIGVGPGEVQDRIGELAAFLLVQLAHPQEDLREDVLVEPRSRRAAAARRSSTAASARS